MDLGKDIGHLLVELIVLSSASILQQRSLQVLSSQKCTKSSQELINTGFLTFMLRTLCERLCMTVSHLSLSQYLLFVFGFNVLGSCLSHTHGRLAADPRVAGKFG